MFIKRKLKKGTIEKEKSYIMAVPKNQTDVKSIEQLIEQFKTNSEFEYIGIKKLQNPAIIFKYKDTVLEAELIVESAEFTDMYIINQKFIGNEFEELKNAKTGITVGILFGESAVESFHIQIKLLNYLVPDMLGIIDFSSLRVITGRWAMLAAKSEIPPSPDYIFTIHAVGSKNGQVWLHTHGLNRCGVIDFEILNSNKKNYAAHGSVLTTLCNIAISTGEMEGEEEPKFIINLGNEELIVTWLDWAYAIKKHFFLKHGGPIDRMDSHNNNTGVVYVYRSHSDCSKRKFSHISIYDKLLEDNPLMMFTVSETYRMKALAMERFNYFEEFYNKPGNSGVIKFGIVADDEYQKKDREEPYKEHIWFEVKEVNGDKIRAVLTQEPYYLKDYKEGNEYIMDKLQVTDWILFTKTDRVTPDTVYLL